MTEYRYHKGKWKKVSSPYSVNDIIIIVLAVIIVLTPMFFLIKGLV